MKIGLISDTHSYLDPKVFSYFENCDQIWHLGDIGSLGVLEQLQNFKPTFSVFGNIDSAEIRRETKEYLVLENQGKKALLIHIAGPVGKYTPQVRKLISEIKPQIFLCGHSHILKVLHDTVLNHKFLHVNPGAAGVHGFHKVRTLIRFDWDDNDATLKNMEVIELGIRA